MTTPHPGIAVISCLFSHQSDAMRKANLRRFLAGLDDQGVRVFLIELAYDDHPFLLPRDRAHIQLRSANRLWHKERLLNLLVPRLPQDIDKVVWADADVLFSERHWVPKTAEILDQFVVAQPFSHAVRMGPDQVHARDDDHRLVGFACRSSEPGFHLSGGMRQHGHTGFAWAARRDFLEDVGLFDCCLSGSGDHVMAHGFVGDTASVCIQRHLIGAPAYAEAFRAWAGAAHAATGGRIGFVPGETRHQYHGAHDGNIYMRRSYGLLQTGFDPARDLDRDDHGLYRINRTNASLQAWQQENFL